MSNVGFATLQVIPSMRGVQAALSRDMVGPSGAAGTAAGEKAGAGFLGSFKRIALVAGGLFAAKEAAQFVKGSISAASDLNETVSKTEIVFGSAAKEVLAFGNTSAKAIGQSKNEALGAAATYGNLFRALGIGESQSAKMSTTMVKLAGDLASFNNVSPTEALDALRSGLVGETEPLKRFGVNLNDATLKAKAMALGLDDGKGVLDANVKAQAAYALIMEQTSLAQGDFARTSGGLANQQRILSAQFENVKARVGQALLPIMVKLVTFANKTLIPIFGKVGGAFRALGAALSGEGITSNGFIGLMERIGVAARKVFDVVKLGASVFAAAFADPDVTSTGWVGVIERIAGAARGLFDFISANLKPILAALGIIILTTVVPAMLTWAAATIAATWPFVAIAAAVLGAIALFQRFPIIGQIVSAVASTITGSLGAAVEWVKSMWPQISEAVGHVLNVVQGIVSAFVTVVTTLWRAWGDNLLAIVRTVWNFIQETIENVVQLVQGVIQTFLAVINGDWGKAWDGIKKVLGAVWDQIGNIISTATGIIRGLLGGFLSTIGEVWSGAWAALKKGASDTFTDVLELVKSLPGKIVSAIGDLGDLLYKAGKAVISGLIDGIKAQLGPLGKVLGGVGGFIADHKGPLDYDRRILRPAGVAIMEGLVRGIHDGLAPLSSELVGVTQVIRSAPFTSPDGATVPGGTDGAMSRPLVVQLVDRDGRKLSETVVKGGRSMRRSMS